MTRIQSCLCAFAASAFTIGSLASVTLAVGPNVIYSEIAAHSSGTVPGALDGAGNPVVTNWLSMLDLSMNGDGSQWVVRGSTTQDATLSNILVKGSSLAGTAFVQEGQPVMGGTGTELYDFFDGPRPVSWDDTGNMAFSFRAKNGVAANFEKIVKVVGGVHTVYIQMGDPALGLIDNPPGNSGDETFGNSMNSVHLLNDGRVGFINTPITNLSSTRYPAFFRGNTSFRQSGVSMIGGEVWDNFDFDSGGGTPDGNHWYSLGDTENPNTAVDNILGIDDTVAIREGSPVAGVGTPIMTAVFFARMNNDGTWFARGDDPADNDWAVRNGVLLAKTGDLISGAENWGVTISGFTGNNNGDWLATGLTNNPNTSLDEVMVFNGTQVILREGDPIDLNGNGLFDDDVFLRTFLPDDIYLFDNGDVYFLATLKNAAGTNLGDAFLKTVIPEPATLGLLGLGALAVLRRRRAAR